MHELLVNIDIDDLEKAIAFYRDGLGLSEGKRLTKTIKQMFRGDTAIFLLEKPSGSVATSASAQRRDYQRHWTPVHLDFIVDDVVAAMDRAERAGAKREGDLQSFDWGRMAVYADPFGHGFCLIEFTAAGYDALIGE